MKCKNCDGQRLVSSRLCQSCETARVRKSMAILNYRRRKTADLAQLAESTRTRLALMDEVLAERSDYIRPAPTPRAADCRP